MSRVRRVRSLFAQPSEAPHPLLEVTEEDRRYLNSLYDDTVPLPAEAHELDPGNPKLIELREAYAVLDLPVVVRSRWHHGAVDSFLDLRWFRGETLFVWHYRERPRISRLKYFIYARYVRDNDRLRLFERLEEDGLFGCWTFTYPGLGTVSRDLLQSINEINFLDRALELSRLPSVKVLDIGAGYGRLAHRMISALPNVTEYYCVDAVPEATFLSDWYLRYRGCIPPARTIRLDRLDEEVKVRDFSLAVNMHSFSECPLPAIRWWIEWLADLEVPNLLIVPNEPDALLSTEPDGRRLDFEPLLNAVGYELVRREPVIRDPAVRELLPLNDHFYLFARP
jgi:SAM-dependent methyltransferase